MVIKRGTFPGRPGRRKKKKRKTMGRISDAGSVVIDRLGVPEKNGGGGRGGEKKDEKKKNTTV